MNNVTHNAEIDAGALIEWGARYADGSVHWHGTGRPAEWGARSEVSEDALEVVQRTVTVQRGKTTVTPPEEGQV